MATLKELVEQATRTPQDTLKQLDAQELKVRSDMESAKQRLAATEKELEFTRPLRDAARDRVEGLKKEVEALEKQLLTQKSQLLRASDEYQEKTEQASQVRKDRSLAEAASQDAERRMRDLDEQKKRAKQALKAAHRSALRRFVETTGERLAQFAATQDKKKTGLAALERLRNDRNSDPAVGTMCEAREELKRMLDEARVPYVISAMRAELDGVEKKIEAKYPGAIAAESQQSGEEIEEIYFTKLTSGRVRLFLPLQHDVWGGLEGGKAGIPEDTAVRMVWELRKGLSANWEDSEVEYLAEIGVVLDLADCPDVADLNVTVPIGKSGSITFMFAPLPSSVEGAVHEDISAS